MSRLYGQSLALDIHNCNPEKYKNRALIHEFVESLCDEIDMEIGDLHFWDYAGYPKEYDEAPENLKGASVVQFIKTSTIVIHTLDDLKRVYVDIFSCKSFDDYKTIQFVLKWCEGKIVNQHSMARK